MDFFYSLSLNIQNNENYYSITAYNNNYMINFSINKEKSIEENTQIKKNKKNKKTKKLLN